MNSDVPVKSPPIRDFIILAGIAAILVVLRLTFLHEPFERDEGFYSTIGQVILDGGVPYRDAIDMKPPGVFYIYAFAIALFGKTVASIRIFTAIYSIFTLAAVYWLSRRLAGSTAGLFAAALFAIHSGAPLVQGSSSNSEVFMNLPLTLGACFFVAYATSASPRRSLIAFSGLFMGLAMLIKTVALPYVALTFLFCFFARTEKPMKERVLDPLLFIAPVVGVGLATVAYFFARGALQEFITFNVTLPFFYSKGGGIVGLPPAVVTKYLLPEFLVPALVSVPTSVWLLATRKDAASRYAALLLPAACFGVAMPGKYFPHYYIQLMPFLALLGGIGLAALVQRRKLLPWLALPLVAAFLYTAWYDYRFYLVMTPEEVSIQKYGPTFVDSVVVADYLRKNTVPGDYIFQWGFEPELYFLTDRRTPVPIISSTIPETLQNPEQGIKQMMAALREKKPRYIIVQKEWAMFPGMEQVGQLLREEYQFDTTLRYAAIFKRR